jgi:hypothetical protein
VAELLFRSILTLALGSLLSLPFISVREIGRGFFTLWVGIVVALGSIALALRLSGAGGRIDGTGSDRAALLLGLCLSLLIVFWLALRLGVQKTATVALIGAAFAGALVLRELAIAHGEAPGSAALGAADAGSPGLQSAQSDASRPPAAGISLSGAPTSDAPLDAAGNLVLRVSSLLLSALAVGMVTVAMVLGHWYLVQPKLAIAPLRRVCDALIGVLLARMIVSAWGFATCLRHGFAFFGGGEPIPWELLILSQRLLFGFGGSLFLAVLVKKTVALRSTMSATGLLYIAILFVWVGEFLSIYLGRLTGGALVV